ncbi:triokinase/FMN cyclase-like isoform X1 [Pseudomyrmex gracilis]|uniref:triokinase/FMN cyclase-like isoform X1 n=1 Tax=Pseudomyrmex gracilis TaxID=219809 RepID=UPI0009953D25|nr:triokinase/FMN cyclase-like isoform X1 [Pseudomyrmex gracilis]
MLTASIAGSIFTAPPSGRIMHAFKCIASESKAGILVVIPNYTGDCLNFGIAIEKAKLSEIMVKEVIVGDDCSIPAENQSIAGRRGLVGMLFVIKIASALAETGASLDEVAELATYVSQHIATYGIGLSACVVPMTLQLKIRHRIQKISLSLNYGVREKNLQY